MKNCGMQKAIALLVVLVISFSCIAIMSPCVYATSEGKSISDGVEGLMRYLGIISEQAPDYNKVLTRGELAHIAAGVVNAPEYTEDATLFFDVMPEHLFYQDVHALSQLGIIHGDGDGLYRPDDAATDLEVCKVFSVILGYDPLGYFETYFRVANRIGITDGVALDGTMTYGDAITMAYNTLHTEISEPVTYGGSIEYQVQKGFFALERYHGLVQEQGVVEGAFGSTLTHPDSNIPDGKIRINHHYYDYDDETVLGKYVIFYCERDRVQGGLKPTIKYLYVPREKNNIIIISGEDVIGKSGSVFKYWVENKEKTVPLIEIPDLIYNGIAYPDYTPSDLKPGSGTVTLIDNNKDNVFDVIAINAYEYVVCNGVDVEKKLIYCRYPEKIIGSTTQNTDLILRNEKGKIMLSRLKAGDVLAVQGSKNIEGTRKVYAEIILESITGTVEAVKGDTFKVEGQEFKMTLATITDNPSSETKMVKVGELVTVYIHHGACAAVIHAKNQAYRFGYLVNARNSGTGFSGKLTIQLVDSNRVLREYDAVKEVKVDEAKSSDVEGYILPELLKAASRTYHNDSTEFKFSQPVRYRLNDSGKLTHIDTLIYNPLLETEDSLQLSVSPGDYPLDEAAGGTMYNGYTQNIESVSEDKTLMTLPSSDRILMVADNARNKPEYYMTSLSSGYRYLVEGYNVDPDSLVAQYAIVYKVLPLESVGEDAQYHIVLDISMVLDEDGYPVRQVTLVGPSGAEAKYNVIDQAATMEFAIGDVIQFAGSNSEITMIKRAFVLGDKEKNTRVQGSVGGDYAFTKWQRIAYGTVLAAKDGVITHTTSVHSDVDGVEGRASLHNYKSNGVVKYYVCEMVNGTPQVRIGSAGDMIPYLVDKNTTQNAVMFTQSGNLKLVYIIQ